MLEVFVTSQLPSLPLQGPYAMSVVCTLLPLGCSDFSQGLLSATFGVQGLVYR